jgi:hypothetical protein
VCAARTTQAAPAKLPGTVDETAHAVTREGRRAMAVALDVQDEDACPRSRSRASRVGARATSLDQQRRRRAAEAALSDSIRAGASPSTST